MVQILECARIWPLCNAEWRQTMELNMLIE
jgi:hypothetical protein